MDGTVNYGMIMVLTKVIDQLWDDNGIGHNWLLMDHYHAITMIYIINWISMIYKLGVRS